MGFGMSWALRALSPDAGIVITLEHIMRSTSLGRDMDEQVCQQF